MRLRPFVPFVAACLLAAPLPARADDRTADSVFGYTIASVPLTQVSAVWNVATATPHVAGEAESAMEWISVGGGCVTDDCVVRDSTVLKVGTESSVDASGNETYRAWYTAAPLAKTYTSLAVHAGDVVRGTIARDPLLPVTWRLTLDNLTSGTAWTTTTPSAPVAASAQVLVETPVFYDEFQYAYPLMPDLGDVTFDRITVNGASAILRPGDRVVMVAYMDLDVVGTPSLPQADGNGFGACAWATTCAVPPDL